VIQHMRFSWKFSHLHLYTNLRAKTNFCPHFTHVVTDFSEIFQRLWPRNDVQRLRFSRKSVQWKIRFIWTSQNFSPSFLNHSFDLIKIPHRSCKEKCIELLGAPYNLALWKARFIEARQSMYIRNFPLSLYYFIQIPNKRVVHNAIHLFRVT
jgi:hypothetical protein